MALLALGAFAPAAAAQDLPPPPPAAVEPLRLLITMPPDPGVGAPVIRATGLLQDAVFAGALRDGFPVRFQFRLELWRASRLFDRLERALDWFALAELDPLNGSYTLTRSDGSEEELAGLNDLRLALAVPYTVDLPPPENRGRSRYYFVATLNIESLSLSELEEMERWLRGDLGPAITSEGDVGNALERGARRLLIRFSGLPRRRLEVRSPVFVF